MLKIWLKVGGGDFLRAEKRSKNFQKLLTAPCLSVKVGAHTVKTQTTNMRTKALLGAAILAAGALTSMAQSNVYSLNIVGYVNVNLQGNNKLDLLTVPLIPANNDYDCTNTIVLPDAADGAFLYRWTGTSWDNTIPQWLAGYGWYGDVTTPAGSAFYIQSPAAATITFVGQVATGTLTNKLASGVNFVADTVPVAERWPGGLVGNDGDFIYTWTGSAWNNTIWQYLGGYGWYDGVGADPATTNGPVMTVGNGVLYQALGGAITWQRSFNP